ncbi:phospholipase A2 inhibitor beta-like [Onthophagus taurus]|uniref:phospholipase A2 inhibitor beta-like n=1 Tax=Onthophagus taurus TaxID=166361 RepID=UPI000C204657|nr:leucine-rich repeat-containing protein 15-like [Onthophagus taurus]
MLVRVVLFLPFFLILHHTVQSGFIEGEPCSDRNTALLNPTRPVWPIDRHNIRCVDMRNMGNTSWFTYIKKMKNVTTIFADSMMLKRIPRKVVSSLPKLEVLDVTNNSIQRIHPLMFKHNPKFVVLLLSNNKLLLPKKRPFLMSQSLTTLYLSKNYIKNIPVMTFTGLPMLRELFLDSNELVSINPKAFKHLSNLKMLHLGNNLLRFIPPKETMGPNLVRYIIKSNPRGSDIEDFQ